MNTIIVTGATSGIGLSVVRELLTHGYRVIGIGHSENNTNKALVQLNEEFPNGDIVYHWGDLMQQREVRRIAEELKQYIEAKCESKLFALINNAGCTRGWYTTTEEGYEQQFALNHLAGFLLTHYMITYLINANGRIIMTGSGSHKNMKVHWKDIMFQKHYHPLLAYKQSKLFNMLFAEALNKRFLPKGIHSYVVDPGLVNTDIGFKDTGGLVGMMWKIRKRGGVSPNIPAKTYSNLCEDKPKNGLYHYLCKEAKYSKYVTEESADRLFILSETLCGIKFGRKTDK